MFLVSVLVVFLLVQQPFAVNSQVTFQNVTVYGYYYYQLQFNEYINSANILRDSIPPNDIRYMNNFVVINQDRGYNKLIISNQTIDVLFTGSFSNLVGVEEIVLEFNGINLLEVGCFQELHSLQKLWLGHNRIQIISKDVFSIPNLRVLDLSHNNIAIIENYALNGLHNLESLNLAYNNLMEWKLDLTNTGKLTWLNLGYNKLNTMDFETFQNVSAYFNLYLSCNLLTDITLNHLTVENFGDLWLDHNAFSDFPSGLIYLENIKVNNFRINFNNISYWDEDAVEFVVNAEHAYIDYNPMTCDSVKRIQDAAHRRGKSIVIPCASTNCLNPRVVNVPDNSNGYYRINEDGFTTWISYDSNRPVSVTLPPSTTTTEIPSREGRWKQLENGTYVWTTDPLDEVPVQTDGGYWHLLENGTYVWRESSRPTPQPQPVPQQGQWQLLPNGSYVWVDNRSTSRFWKLNSDGKYVWALNSTTHVTLQETETKLPVYQSTTTENNNVPQSNGHWELSANGSYIWVTSEDIPKESPTTERFINKGYEDNQIPQAGGHWELSPNGTYVWVNPDDAKESTITVQPIANENNGYVDNDISQPNGYWHLSENGSYVWINPGDVVKGYTTTLPPNINENNGYGENKGKWVEGPDGTYDWVDTTDIPKEVRTTMQSTTLEDNFGNNEVPQGPWQPDPLYPEIVTKQSTTTSQIVTNEGDEDNGLTVVNGHWAQSPNGTYVWVSDDATTTPQTSNGAGTGHWEQNQNGTYVWVNSDGEVVEGTTTIVPPEQPQFTEASPNKEVDYTVQYNLYTNIVDPTTTTEEYQYVPEQTLEDDDITEDNGYGVDEDDDDDEDEVEDDESPPVNYDENGEDENQGHSFFPWSR